jgi:hypothetical protein
MDGIKAGYRGGDTALTGDVGGELEPLRPSPEREMTARGLRSRRPRFGNAIGGRIIFPDRC